MVRKLYTIGYGNDMQGELRRRIKEADVNVIYDVRRDASSAWCSAYHQGYSNMGVTLHEICTYWPLPWAGNYSDSLEDYREKISARLWNYRWSLEQIAAFIDGNSGIVPCILCAEKKPEESHRTIFAEVLLECIGNIKGASDWVIEHL